MSARSKSMCGDTGVSTSARWRGDTIGPRADSEYAVDPVGVATMSPSAAYDVNTSPPMRTSMRTVCPDCVFSTTASLSARKQTSASGDDARPNGDREHHAIVDLVVTGEEPLERASVIACGSTSVR